jgi:AbrB family looped-hinge helix DNA binding protein
MNLAKISTNGQVTIPIEVRRMLKASSGDKLVFVRNEKGEIIVQNLNVATLSIGGSELALTNVAK